jgi:chitinase
VIRFIVCFISSFFFISRNFSFHCDTVCKDRSSVLCCPSIGSAIRQCQKNKKIVLLSLGGAAGTYFFTSEDAAKQFADGIWNMFLGGTSGDLRPFGPGVILNGVDLDIEGGISQGYGSFVDRLRARFGETPKRKFYITGAPQCPFPVSTNQSNDTNISRLTMCLFFFCFFSF